MLHIPRRHTTRKEALTPLAHCWGQARLRDDPSAITRLGVDETSSKKSHSYVTLGVDLDSARVIHVCEGKGKQTIAGLARHLLSKYVPAEQIEHLSMDLSRSFFPIR